MVEKLWYVERVALRGPAYRIVIVSQVLTGATGALGAHLLDQLRKREDVSQIICLVRAKDPVAAHERVRKCLLQRKKDPVLDSDGKVVCHVAKLSDGRLGLPEDVFDDVAERATIIIHAAWAVNFSMRLKSFVKDHIAGECPP